jgi:hypothetical protein
VTEFRDRLLTAPRWVIGLISGLLFGAVMGGMNGLRHGRWAEAFIEGAIAAVVYGAIMGVVMHRQFGRYREAVGDVPQSEVRRAVRQAGRGSVPEDPEVRAAAYRLLITQRDELRRLRPLALVVLLVLAASGTFLAIAQRPGWWEAWLVWVLFLVLHLVVPRRLGRRLELLRD